MKYFFATIILITSVSLFGQAGSSTINWTSLIGKWKCTKVVWEYKGKSEDVSNMYKNYVFYFFADLKYREEHPDGNETVDGQYAINKTSKIISYKKLIQTIKYPPEQYPKAKGITPDLVQSMDKYDDHLIKLTSDQLILLEKEGPTTEGPGDYRFYFIKVK